MILLMVDDRALRLRQGGRQPRPTPRFVEPTPNPIDFLVGNYLRTAPAVAKSAAETNIFNPVPSITRAVNQGRLPSRGEVGTDAAFAAVGMIPFGGKAARPALETGEAIAARRQAINRLLNTQGPKALEEYLQRPLTAYLPTQNPDLLRRFFAETSERIPVGTQMYRAPSAGQVMPRRTSQSMPLPREVGAEWLPNRVQSAAGSGDLQHLGGLFNRPVPGNPETGWVRGMSRRDVPDTGGNQSYAPGMVAIEAMEDLPGIYNLNDYLAAISNQGFINLPTRSTFGVESVLAPQTRYVVRDFNPSGADGFPTWYLNAYAR